MYVALPAPQLFDRAARRTKRVAPRGRGVPPGGQRSPESVELLEPRDPCVGTACSMWTLKQPGESTERTRWKYAQNPLNIDVPKRHQNVVRRP